MVQGGDPTGTGRGGESIYGGKFEDEINRELHHTGAGILSMANSGPNTNGSQVVPSLSAVLRCELTVCPHKMLVSCRTVAQKVLVGGQFFITLAPQPHLDGKHTIFGRVYSGMGVVKRLGNVQTGGPSVILLFPSSQPYSLLFCDCSGWSECICEGGFVNQPFYCLISYRGHHSRSVSHQRRGSVICATSGAIFASCRSIVLLGIVISLQRLTHTVVVMLADAYDRPTSDVRILKARPI